MANRVKTLPGAEQRSYYKYYLQDMAVIPAEKQEFLKDPWQPAENAHLIDDRNAIFDAGYMKGEVGLYPTPEGGIVCANKTDFAGSKGSMLQWWFGWHGLDPLRYACWDPYDHYGLELSFEDRAKILDPATTIAQKCYDVQHVVSESLVVGEDPMILYINFRDPAKMGIDTSKIFTDACSFLVCANVEIKTPMGHFPVVMLHTARDTEQGCELRSRFWMGYNIIGGKAQYLMPNGMPFPKEVGSMLLGHNFLEFTNLARILPDIYAEEKDNWE